jgi:serine/threonine protein kinase
MPAASDYELLETIGQGSFGKVCKIRRKVDGKVRRPSASLNLPTHRQ